MDGFVKRYMYLEMAAGLLLVTSCHHRSPLQVGDVEQALRPSVVDSSPQSQEASSTATEPGGGVGDSDTGEAVNGAESAYRELMLQQLHDRVIGILGPAHVPPPGVDPRPQSRTLDGFQVRVWPLRPEDADWNRWTEGTFRLFNNGMGYLWGVSVSATTPIQWIPQDSLLKVNTESRRFEAAPSPEKCFEELLYMARLGVSQLIGIDISARLARADEFLSRYMPLVLVPGRTDAVVFFPAPARALDPVAMELDLSFNHPQKGKQVAKFLFE